MKPNTKYLDENGYEFFMMPFSKMNITQGSNTWSHSGVMAIDVTNGDGSKAPYYSPCTCKCIATYPQSGQAVWVSTNKVHFANGNINYVVFVTAHDESFNAYVGMTIPQGSQIANMGNKGVGTGTHAHFQVGVGYPNTWGIVKGYFTLSGVRYPVYGFQYEPYDIDDLCFINDTTIIGGSGNWKKCTPVSNVNQAPSVPTSSEEIDQILHVGSYVTSGPMKIGNQGLKTINGSLCCYLAEIGGWFPIEYVSEYDASDGKKDNYLANTNARVYIDRVRVDSIKNGLAQIHGIWVKAGPLVEVK
ncbi:M23 family metallopeptidase [Floccifex sp.]|uniref:M23 family metallopeptidase n=1 Tax=Floccifex sp. TaxID=2815810 RepID=UPI003F081468